MTTGYPDWSIRQISSATTEEQQKVDATATAANMTFTTTVHSWRLYNDGPNAVHYRIGATATTAYFKLPPKSWLMVDVPATTISLICASGETATVYGAGVR